MVDRFPAGSQAESEMASDHRPTGRDHPADGSGWTLRALGSLRQLMEACEWLEAEMEAAALPGVLGPRRPARLSARAIAAHGRTLRAERAERIVADRAGITQTGVSQAPIRPALLDAAQLAHAAVLDCVWVAASSLRRRPLVVYGAAWEQVYGAPWRARTAYLAAVLPLVRPLVARELAGYLGGADDAVRGVLGVGPSWHRLPGLACPDCDRRSVEAECSSLAEQDWIMRCEAGCWVSTVGDYGRRHGRLGDILALVASVRRQMRKRERRAA